MTIPLPFLYALVPVIVTAGIAFTAWVVRQLGEHAALMATTATKLEDHGARIERLEVFQDGMQAGRAIEQSVQRRRNRPSST